jgi:hypothetical protein
MTLGQVYKLFIGFLLPILCNEKFNIIATMLGCKDGLDEKGAYGEGSLRPSEDTMEVAAEREKVE